VEGYLAVRAHGLKLHLLKPSDYDKVLRSRDPVSTLASLGYSDVVGLYGKSWTGAIKAIYAKLVRRLEPLMATTPHFRSFFRAFLDRLEAANCKARLRELMGGRVHPALYYPYSHHLSLGVLSSVSDIKSYSKLLSRTPYGALIEDALEIYEEVGRIAVIEASIDSSYYSYYLGASREAGFERFSRMEGRVYGAYWRRVFEELPPKALKLLDALPVGELATREYSWQQAMRELIANLRDIARRDFVGRGYVFAYIISCWVEAINLERILVAKRLEVEDELVKRLLLPSPL